MSVRTAIFALVLAASLVGGAAVGAATFLQETRPAGTPPPTRIDLGRSRDPILVGAGDIAEWPPGARGRDEETADLLDAIVRKKRGRVTVFTAGDNAYDSGLTSEYASYYTPTWGRYKAITRPAPGNHEYYSKGAAGYFRYFGVRPYYAYDLGAWRVYSLNSEVPHQAGSPQERWLRRDLTAHPRHCVMAYWHRPRYSAGPHGSDASMQALWQALADHHADVIVSAHDHDYERYAPRDRIREFVVGTGGNYLYPFTRSLAGIVARSDHTWGVIVFTLHRAGYDFRFIPVAGQDYRDRGSFACSN